MTGMALPLVKGEGGRGGIGVYLTAELKKNTFKTSTKIRLKPKIVSKTV